MDMTPEEVKLLENYRAGRPILCNFNIGLGVKVDATDETNAKIEVDPRPQYRKDWHALEQTMRSTIRNWQSILARPTTQGD